MRKPKTVLPPDVFDALELSALANGGVGASCLSQNEFEDSKSCTIVNRPVCIIGHGLFLDGMPAGVPDGQEPGEVVAALAKAFGFYRSDYGQVYSLNDNPVANYIAQNSPDGNTTKEDTRYDSNGDFCSSLDVEKKVTWKTWCKLVGVKRGKEQSAAA